ncbi:exonuclease domain-containing protein [Nocardia crassostreae]|uniref:exonuclease domain-containing protein n=1 Tax=Nocardia crassostreae TaxID=53428 RepID=UPI0009FEB8C4|nr:exonuclease domain-containing protein [Nocardia crassostreae]
MVGLSFAAIDVETANSSRGSICAVGVTVVREGVRRETHSWLCRPPAALDFFARRNIRIHGISPVVVADQPVFAHRWPEIRHVVADLPLVAHNAGFDSGAIRDACTHSGIEVPTWEFICSLYIARRHLDLESYRLPHVADALGVELLAHHNAAADAAAAADIVLALAARVGVSSLSELERSGEERPYRPRRTTRRTRGSFFPREELIAPEVTGSDPSHPLYNQIVVFTGELASMTRQEAWNAIASCGATPAKNVTRRTTCLVIGDGFTGRDATGFTTTKARRAAELQMRGQQIDILDEERLAVYLDHSVTAPPLCS